MSIITFSRSFKIISLLALSLGMSLLAGSVAFQPASSVPSYRSDLVEQLAQLNNQAAALGSEAYDLHNQIDSFTKQISDTENNISNLQTEIQQLQQQDAALTGEISNLRQQLTNLQSQLSSAKASLIAAQQNLDQLKKSLQEASNNVQKLQSTLQQQQATLQSYISTRDQAQASHDSLLNQWNSRVGAYNDRLNTYNQKLADYNARWEKLKQEIVAAIAVGAILALATYLSGGFALSDVPTILGVLSALGLPNVQQMWTEYNDLQQLKSWLDSEQGWLQNESQRLQDLKAQLDQATNQLDHWNNMVSNQQALVAKTQRDLDYWTSKQNDLKNQVATAQANVDQLTSEVNSIENQVTKIQSSLQSDQEKQQQLRLSIENDKAKLNELQTSLLSLNKQKTDTENNRQEVITKLRDTLQRAVQVNHEINLVDIQPFLRWGAVAALAIPIVTLIATAIGIDVETSLGHGRSLGIGFARSIFDNLSVLGRGKRPRRRKTRMKIAEGRHMEARVASAEVIAPTESTTSKDTSVQPKGRRSIGRAESRYCLNCGHKLPRGSLFCNKCGADQSTQ